MLKPVPLKDYVKDECKLNSSSHLYFCDFVWGFKQVCKLVPKNPAYKTATLCPIQGHPWSYKFATGAVLHFKMQGICIIKQIFLFMTYWESVKHLYYVRNLMVDIQTQIEVEIKLKSWIDLLGLSFHLKDQKIFFHPVFV